MFNNCKDCRRYRKRVDDFYHEMNDEEDADGNSQENHYCIAYGDNGYIIPRGVWDATTLCPHYGKPNETA